ncbi:MAG TPA: 2,3-diphosphoglycerate-dependent phosphoglycerate mutase [bacterium]|nr:2,3-diphosphoglycerate-dependent phosphoglycerate mutase [bacterium]HPT29445.1 2,3-diphosphoglycerate-dependent phosphoglycerate mutase [bacterium]
MFKIVFVRHGESEWNKKNLFCGWYDSHLSPQGEKEALAAGKILKKNKYFFDYAFASPLSRAIKTLDIVLTEMDLDWVPVEKPWQLSERHYGDLTGKNKSQTLKKFGLEQFMKWRRSYDIRPPKISEQNKYRQIINNDPRFAEAKIPETECLADVIKRVLPYWKKQIVPRIKQGKKIIISGHGNAFRAIIQYLDKIPNQEIVQLNLPFGVPLVYELDKKLRPIRHYYLGDQKKIKAAIEKVRNQGRRK